MSYQFMMPDIIPYHAHWDITTGCNQKCVFCLTSSGKRDPNELSTEDAFPLVDKLYDEGIWFLKILGGEPFFRKDTLKLMKYAADKGMILSFSTNASLIDDTIASNLFEIRNSIIYLQMSLYGESKETYQEITQITELNFDTRFEGIKLLVDRGIDVTILTVATENNAHKVLESYDIAKTYGAKEFRLTTEIALGQSAGKLKQKLEKTPEYGVL